MRKPRKAANAGGRSTLFWVHTDPQSVSEGTREETLKRIRSHVMSEHNRKKRLENTKRYKSKTFKHLAFQPVETIARPPDGHVTASSSSSASERRVSKASSSRSNSSTSSTSRSGKLARREEFLLNAAAAAADAAITTAVVTDSDSSPASSTSVTRKIPWSPFLEGGIDPFDTTHTPLSDRMSRHLQLFLGDLTLLAYPFQNRIGPRIQQHCTSLVQKDPASLHACICVAASTTALRTGLFPLVDPAKRYTNPLILDTFHHRGETIRLVNEGLSDPVKAASNELIFAVSVLLTIEIASGNADYLKIHLAGLRQMVSLRKNLADVPLHIRFQIAWTDIRVACMSFTRPIFPFIRSDSPPQYPLIPPDEDLVPIASRLMSLVQIPGIFGDAMSKIIYDLSQLTLYAEWLRRDASGYLAFDEVTEDYFNTEVLYLEYALHSDRYTEQGEVKGDATIEGCVRLACLLFHNTAIWNFYPQMAPLFAKPVSGLRQAIEATIATGQFELCPDLLVWVLFVGACCSPSHLPIDRSFFVAELAAAVRLHGFRSWGELRTLLLGFLYVDRSYLAPLKGLWDELKAGTIDDI
ncbi:hypothetical protein ASPZODRAFT_115707 [Penicilliopsis zonata CBS 506.65]|uniref:Transcription factor domain-containing protein n=1 Tax=Penicilliopsis zonata CBS 506.65 TaxID=1073090 RepID=A0A1L9SIJ9_9EURO|nr:hypothetical protein ASPZODRAFT_115707 [Penicilliopsis zonata CBS 506.65]OJJ46936.1 hypothetical protein ASPZODRAFT_115707 [Penicilliopsis zonata CBS 506.65]